MGPTQVAEAGMGTTAAGGILGMFGSLLGGKTQQAMYNYQAGIAKINAQYIRQAGEVEAQQSGMRTRAEIGQTKAIEGASNLDVNKGSAPLVRTSEAKIGQENMAIIRSNAAHRAFGQDVQASIDVSAGKNAVVAGEIGAASSILGAASSVSSKWMQGNQIGLWDNA